MLRLTCSPAVPPRVRDFQDQHSFREGLGHRGAYLNCSVEVFKIVTTTWFLRGLPALNPIAGAACGLIAVSCASNAPILPTNSVAHGSENFDLGRPVFVAKPNGAMVEGRACRRRLSVLLSPEHVRLEDIAPNGAIRNVADAYLPLLSARYPEQCEHYYASVKWRPSPGDTVRVCFERGGPCPGSGVSTLVRP